MLTSASDAYCDACLPKICYACATHAHVEPRACKQLYGQDFINDWVKFNVTKEARISIWFERSIRKLSKLTKEQIFRVSRIFRAKSYTMHHGVIAMQQVGKKICFPAENNTETFVLFKKPYSHLEVALSAISSSQQASDNIHWRTQVICAKI